MHPNFRSTKIEGKVEKEKKKQEIIDNQKKRTAISSIF